MAEGEESSVGGLSEQPAWKQRAVERSIQSAKVRAEQRVQRFLDAAQVIIAEKSTTDFTVQEVVDRSGQSLRSFYLHFDGKHELLLALFEDALSRTAEQIHAAATGDAEPLDRLKVAIQLLFELCRVDTGQQHPLFTEFAPQLLLTHPTEVRTAHGPLLTVFTDLLTEAIKVNELRTDMGPRRLAALIMQTVMFNAQFSATNEETTHPITADEVWTFCAHGFASES